MKFVLLALFVAVAAAAPAEKNSKDVASSPIIMPEPAFPEVIEDQPAQGTFGEVFNDGTVQVSVNAPEDSGMFGTLQSWFSMVVNYISNGIQSSQQII